MKKRWFSLGVLLVLLITSLACGGGRATPTPQPTTTPLPPTATPLPTDTPEPTATPAGEMREPISQWAIRAEASSEYGETSWTAEEATGAPDTLECGDFTTAWAAADGYTVEWLEVYFEYPVYATELHIIQTYFPDQVVEIEFIDADGNYVSAYNQEPEEVTSPCPYTLSIAGEQTDYLVQGARITVDQSVLNLGWNEIDAVELVGIPTEDVEVTTPEPTEEATGPTEPIEDVIWRYGGESGAWDEGINSLTGMDVAADGTLYVADNLSRLLVFSPEGEMLEPIEVDGMWTVSDVKVGDDGRLYLADWGSEDGSVLILSPEGELLYQFGMKGIGDGEFDDFSPEGLAVCPDGNLYVADDTEDANEESYERIQVFDGEGNYLRQWNIYDDAPNYGVSAMDCGPDGNLYLIGFIGGRVLVYDTQGNLVSELGEDAIDFSAPNSIAVGDDGTIYVGTWNEGLLALDADGNLIDSWGENSDREDAPRVEGELHFPDSVTVDSEGNVYLGDWGSGYSYISKFIFP